MEYFLDLLHQILYLRIGKIVFGIDFEANPKSVRWWQRMVLFSILLFFLIGVMISGFFLYGFLRPGSKLPDWI